MTHTPHPDPDRAEALRDAEDRALIDNAIADTAAGIMPGGPSAVIADIESHAAMDDADHDPDGSMTRDDDAASDPALTEDRR